MRRRNYLVASFVTLSILCAGRPALADDALKEAVAPLVAELAGAVPDRRELVAVAPFEGLGEAKGLEGPLAEAVVAGLQEARLEVRDPRALQAALGEGTLNELLGGDAAAVGRLATAAVLVTGQVGLLDDTVVLDVRMLDSTSGEVLQASSVRLPRSLLPAAEARPRTSRSRGTGDSVEVALRRLADEVAEGMRSALPDGNLRYARVAVVDFEETGDRTRRHELGTVVGAELGTLLRRDHGLLLIERSRIGQVLGEQALGMTGAIDAGSAAQAGQVLGADFLVLGEVSEVGDHYRVNARIVDTEDAQVVAAASTSLPAGGLIALSADAVVLRSRSGATFRSVLIPGWGQFYNRQEAKGTLYLSGEVALFATAGVFHYLGHQDERLYRAPMEEFAAAHPEGTDLSAAAVTLRERAESRYRTRNSLLYVAGALWLVNVVDAWAFGAPGSSSSGPGFALAPWPLDGGGFVLTTRW
jgi:TolB-like protein